MHQRLLKEVYNGMRTEIQQLKDYSLDSSIVNSNRRRFFAAFGKKYIYRWGMLGIDLEMAQEAYRLRFGVDSLSKLSQAQWAIAAADMQSAVRSNMMMISKADAIKTALLGALGRVA